MEFSPAEPPGSPYVPHPLSSRNTVIFLSTGSESGSLVMSITVIHEPPCNVRGTPATATRRGDINTTLSLQEHHQQTLLWNMSLVFEEHVFDPRPRFPFVVTMKCYPNPRGNEKGFTLIITHGTGFPKEVWQPIIERIFATENAKPDGLGIREAWAIDAPNHGDAAALNADLLRSGAYDLVCERCFSLLPDRPSRANTKLRGKVSWENYSRAIHLILTGRGAFTDGKNQPVKVDFTGRRLIGVGHSMGGVSLYV
jgi:pimeloyl-ACP methyl ester carboxylesterase